MRQALFTDVAHDPEIAIGKGSKIAHQVRTPISTPYHSNLYSFCHITALVCFLPYSNVPAVPPSPLPQRQVCGRNTAIPDDFWKAAFPYAPNRKASFGNDARPIPE